MVKNVFSLSLLFFLCISGCASKLGSVSSIRNYEAHLGTIQGETFKTLTFSVLQRHGYVVENIDDRPEIIVIKTRWKFREISIQEEEHGIKDGKYMIILEARSRATMVISGGATLYKVKMRVEHMVKKDDIEYWNPAPVEPPFKDVLDRVRNDLKLEYLSRPRYSFLP